MTAQTRDMGGPMAIVNRFTVKEDTRLFEREFLQHAGWFGSQASIDFMATFQVIKRPEVYLHFGFWQTLAAFLDAVHDETYLLRAERLGRMMDTHADQTVSVRRVLGEKSCDLTTSTAVFITHFKVSGNCREFERNLYERCDIFAEEARWCGTQVLRSIISPRSYINLEWAHASGRLKRAHHNARYRRLSSMLVEAADVVTEEARCVASQSGDRTLIAPPKPSREAVSPAGRHLVQ
ncbi:hypothetical protein [Streptomyces johnsoniae]|uniref:Antibiotic biosynthesis monooxygenase n=1 Tax=Streptomyces johnsoniae TaxID=3075532 RepID=A0ABU2RWE2_9ACTN|nr:hypothetical protein [Streptomyces sp. DSM 41886]MDT0441062.1 hypothetical protein [Streptomyces sp. DSM 41886]